MRKFSFIFIGQFIACVAFSRVLIPNNLAPVGLGGVATLLNKTMGLDIQLMLVVLCLPIIIWAYFKYDRIKLYYAALCYGVFTFYFGFVDAALPAFITDPIIASVTGGIMLGVASGMIIGQAVPNGPEAVVGLYLKEKRDINVPTFLMIVNMVIIAMAVMYADLTLIVYSVIANYISGRIANAVVIGTRRYYVVNIVSEHYLDITRYIHNELNRSVTFVQSMDTTTLKKKMLLKTVISSREMVRLKEYVKTFEDDSFVYAIESASILGGGFE